MIGPICIYGNPILRKHADEVAQVTDETRQLVSEMLEFMHRADGIGLAAEQVGLSQSVFVLDIPAAADKNEQGLPENPGVEMPLACINPEIIGASEACDVAEEGCLSFPKLYVPVSRPSEVVVRFLDLSGNQRVVNAKGLLARAIQHELDHLQGVLLVDHMTPASKVKHALLLRKFKKENRNV